MDFPIALSVTLRETLLLYVYDENHGYGFLEYDPVTEELKEIAWRNQGAFFSVSVCDRKIPICVFFPTVRENRG